MSRNRDAWMAALERLHAGDDWRGVIAVKRDPRIPEVLSRWRGAAPPWHTPKDPPPKSPDLAWHALWTANAGTVQTLALMVPGSMAERTVLARYMVEARLVYPDGTIHALLESKFRAQVAAEVNDIRRQALKES